MRRRAIRHALVLVVLAAPLVAAVPTGGIGARPEPQVLAVHAPGVAVALRRFEHAPRVHHVAVAHHVVRPARPAARARVAHEHATTQLVSHRPAAIHRRTLAHSLVLAWPAQGVITTPFIPYGPRRHDGIDIGSLRSLAVTAALGGRVLHVGYTSGFEGYGNIVDVEVAPGVEVLYAHLAAMNVRIGEQVHTGQLLGTAGCTGICYGTHLHFEVRVNGTPVDPVPLLGRG
ncbi:MAG TPA: M23 family metallopeptidase [Gaiellaceae bacterium]|nr:M23 family metallopeptidase [Gaiellaceae bacterium]